jgi:hypothetical protein
LFDGRREFLAVSFTSFNCLFGVKAEIGEPSQGFAFRSTDLVDNPVEKMPAPAQRLTPAVCLVALPKT